MVGPCFCLGEELALEGVQTVLDYFAQDVELGLGTQLWLIRGDTAQGGRTGRREDRGGQPPVHPPDGQ